MPEFVLKKIARILNERGVALNGAKVLLLGVAYKSNVSDTRGTPALKLIQLLVERRVELSYHDPYVEDIQVGGKRFCSVELTSRRLQNTDLVVILTNHGIFDYGFILDNSELLLDTRNAINTRNEGISKL